MMVAVSLFLRCCTPADAVGSKHATQPVVERDLRLVDPPRAAVEVQGPHPVGAIACIITINYNTIDDIVLNLCKPFMNGFLRVIRTFWCFLDTKIT